jgi:tryptophanyl-tRNA synthetase
VFALLKLVASKEELADWKQKYQQGGMGYGSAKKRLLELLVEYFKPYREKREELAADPAYVEQVLEDGARRAKAVASVTLDKVRKAVGIGR